MNLFKIWNFHIPDRHTIIDDSHETKKRKKTAAANAAKHPRHLEETMSVGFGGLLRRLSKRDRDVRRGHHMMRHHPMVSHSSLSSTRST